MIVAVRTMIPPDDMVDARPLSPKMTDLAWSPFITITKTASAWLPTSAGPAQVTPPMAEKSAMRVSLRSNPLVSKPLAIRFFARPEPISPRPITPAFILIPPLPLHGGPSPFCEPNMAALRRPNSMSEGFHTPERDVGRVQ